VSRYSNVQISDFKQTHLRISFLNSMNFIVLTHHPLRI